MRVNSSVTILVLFLLVFAVDSETECEIKLILNTDSSTDIRYPIVKEHGKIDRCTWIINTVNETDYLRILFTNFSLEEPSNSSCLHEYVAIKTDLLSSTDAVRKCGSRPPFEYVATEGRVTVKYFADDTINVSDGFSAVITAVPSALYPSGKPVCGARVALPIHGKYVIQYPRDNMSYTGGEDCIWNIWTYQHSQGIRIQFLDFILEDPIDGKCTSEYLDIYDGWMYVTRPQRKCGYMDPFELTSKTHQLNLHFKSDNLLKYNHGFQFVVTAVDLAPSEKNDTLCETVIALADNATATVDYPPNGQFYTGNENCTWKIIASNETANLRLQFHRFDLENATNGTCSSDFLEIYNGSMDSVAPIRKCGQLDPFTLQFATNEVSLHFVSDPSVTVFTGFKVDITNAPEEKVPDSKPSCDSRIPLTQHGQVEITYPLDGETFTGNDECLWQIWNYDHSQDIRIEFIALNLSEPTGGICVEEYIEINELPFNRDDPKRFCGDKLPNAYTTKNYLATIRFFSDKTPKPGHGLKILVTSIPQQPSPEARPICSTVVAMTAGATTMVDYPGTGGQYTGNDDCYWRITSEDTDDFIQLQFERFDLEGPTGGVCKNDYLDYFDGPVNTTSPLRKCGHLAPFTLTSSSNLVHLHFVSDARPTVFDGFRIKVTATKESKPVCGGHIRLTNKSRWTIIYPFSGGLYGNNEDCRWTIECFDKSKRVEMAFTRFDLEEPVEGNCVHDYLEITDQYNKWRKCGHLGPFTLVSNGYEAELHFVSDQRRDTVGYGFSVDVFPVNAANCDHVIPVDENDVTLHLSDFISNDTSNQNCTWTLMAKNQNSTIHLHLDGTNTSRVDCNDGYLQIDGDDQNSTRVCGQSTDVLGGSKMLMRLVSVGENSPVSQMTMKVGLGDVGCITVISYPILSILALLTLQV